MMGKTQKKKKNVVINNKYLQKKLLRKILGI
jgi:hypothetical protein